MAKRWAVFILIFVGAYLTFVILPFVQRSEEERARKIAHPVELKVVDAETGVELPASGLTAVDASDDKPHVGASHSADPVAPVLFESAPIQIVTTQLARIRFTARGGLPFSWDILPSPYVAEVIDRGTGQPVEVDLIPQVDDRDTRDLPLSLEGRVVSRFNNVLWDVERIDGPGMTTLRYVSPSIEGVQITRTYRIPDDSYFTDLEVTVTNSDARTRIGNPETGWGLGWQGGFSQPIAADRLHGALWAVASVGQSLRMKTLRIDSDQIAYDADIGWAGFEKKYFAALLIPDAKNPAKRVEISVARRNATDEFRAKGTVAPMSVVIDHPAIELAPGESASLFYTIFAGPKDYGLLKKASVSSAPNALPLSDAIFGSMPLNFTWLRPIALLLLNLLRWLESHLGNWGWAIIALVLIVKIALYPLSHWAIVNQAKTMVEMNKVKPIMEEMNAKYKDDAAKRSQEMMKIYREHNINPLGPLRGCFPMLLQAPIFFALYVLLDQAVELRGQSFLWIHDLSEPDRLIYFGFNLPIVGWDGFNILPLFMAGTQYITSRMMMANVTDETQKQVMTLMPIMFVFFLYGMPAGLMLYWTIQNLWQIGHTALTKRYVALHTKAAEEAAAKAAAVRA